MWLKLEAQAWGSHGGGFVATQPAGTVHSTNSAEAEAFHHPQPTVS